MFITPFKTFIHFLNSIHPSILINNSFQQFSTNSAPDSICTSYITLLYKKGDHEDLRNWRPISLLNVDYKILTRILASRLQSVMGTLIHNSQTGFVRKRSIFNNIYFLQHILEECRRNPLPGALCLLDQQKAYDRVEWSYLLQCARKMNLGSNFCQWLEILYSPSKRHLNFNGFLSLPFHTYRVLGIFHAKLYNVCQN